MPVCCCAVASEAETGINFSNEDENGIPYPEEWGKIWKKKVLTYRLNNLSPDIKIAKHQHRAITIAIRTWRLRIPLKFKRVRDPDVYVDINISFQPQEHFRTPKIYARAYYPGQGDASGDVEINDGWDWVTNVHESDSNHPPLTIILIHEIGHSIGLTHDPDDPYSIMYPSFFTGSKKHKLSSRDIYRVQSLYGKRQISSRWIDYFRSRRLEGWDFR
jgi:hypothetical protein